MSNFGTDMPGTPGRSSSGVSMPEAVNLVVRFVLELGALGAVGYWGATVPASPAVRTALAIVLPVATGVVWGTFISPKAPIRSGVAGRAVLGLVVFAAASAALESRGLTRLAGAYLIVAAISSVLFAIWERGRR